MRVMTDRSDGLPLVGSDTDSDIRFGRQRRRVGTSDGKNGLGIIGPVIPNGERKIQGAGGGRVTSKPTDSIEGSSIGYKDGIQALRLLCGIARIIITRLPSMMRRIPGTAALSMCMPSARGSMSCPS